MDEAIIIIINVMDAIFCCHFPRCQCYVILFNTISTHVESLQQRQFHVHGVVQDQVVLVGGRLFPNCIHPFVPFSVQTLLLHHNE